MLREPAGPRVVAKLTDYGTPGQAAWSTFGLNVGIMVEVLTGPSANPIMTLRPSKGMTDSCRANAYR
jgi:hypothetical protein